MKSAVIAIAGLTLLICYANCAKILGVFPLPGRSHYILGSSLMRALAERGHDVTVISCFGEKTPPKNGTYRDILVSENLEKMKEMQSGEQANMYEREGTNPFLTAAFLGYMMPQFIQPTLMNKDVQKLIHSGEKFDLVIVEQFLNDAQKALATHFDAPLVSLSSVGANFWINPLVGNPSPLSYIPDLMVDYSVPMTFSERVTNTLLYIFNELFYHLYVFPKENEIIKKYIPNGPDLKDVLYNASIVLLNAHPSINQPVPYVPNMIDIGGYHVKPPKKLPQELQNFLDEAKDGVIYFSMGSNLKSAEMSIEKREAILKSFSKLKQKVLWKWEDDVLPGQPQNVKLGKWLPQQDILAHPNVKLFITHGGYLSSTETIYHGVPILSIPIYGDQKLNAKNAEKKGYGLTLFYSELSEHKLTEKLQELLNNPKYRNNAKHISNLFRDRPVSPMDTAMYWIEYVIRHRGAPHLRVAALDLPWYKYHLLDVISFILLFSIGVIIISRYLIKVLCKKLCSKQKSTKVKKS